VPATLTFSAVEPNEEAMRTTIASVLPRSRPLGGRERRALVGAFGLLVMLLALTAVIAILGVGGAGMQTFVRDWVSSVIYLLVAVIVAWRAVRIESKRVPWSLFAVGLSVYAVGNILWSLWIEHLPNPPIPSVSDVLWLSFYPFAYAGIVRLAISRGELRPTVRVWLDSLMAAAGLAAIGAALVFGPTLNAATGGSVTVATELAYPVGDLLLAALVIGVLALRGWRLDRGWSLLAGGFLLLAIADCLYSVLVANGSTQTSAIDNLAYVLGVALLAGAAWQAPPELAPRSGTDWSALLIPAGFLVTALGLLLYDHLHRLNGPAFYLVMLTLVAGIARMALAFRDVRSLSEARHLAATDDLTSLPNRRLFMRRVEEAIAAGELTGDDLAVLMFDLDNFKQLNDTLGHHAGDALLRLIGPRLVGSLRDSDIVARLGGDEFAVLLHPAPGEAGVTLVAEKIIAALRQPFEVEGLALRVTGSLGIATYPADANDGAELMQRSDIAMYQAKASRSGYEFYAHERDTNTRARLTIAAELATALDDGSIEVYFQPKAMVRTGTIVGVEALVRWRRSDGTIVPPCDFVSAAEHAGLARPLTRRVIDLALTQLAAWRAAGHDLTIAVNTTVADLLDTGFPGEIAAALAAHGLPAQALVLEVTENSVLADPKRIGTVLAHLAELGVDLSLDDFGTGYSTLSHLKSLPVQEIKIDRSFVARMTTDATDVAIVYALIQLADRLGMRVVAEGVENQETWDALNALDCEVIQGYLLSRPVPAAELDLSRAAPLPVPESGRESAGVAPADIGGPVEHRAAGRDGVTVGAGG
jgi:diguanylate cyclase (GGDEF)-like protein